MGSGEITQKHKSTTGTLEQYEKKNTHSITEAGYSLGLARFRLLKEVVLPQAIFKITPALTGQCINLVKDSTILSIISIQELSFSANNVIATSNLRFEIWLVVAAIYFVICFSLSLLSKRLERKVR